MTNKEYLAAIFGPQPVPEWLLRFEDDSAEAIHSLLCGRFYHGNLQAADPADLLIGWCRLLEYKMKFLDRVDARLMEWINTNWGFSLESSRALADRWSRLFEIIIGERRLIRAEAKLHEYLNPVKPANSAEDYLRPLSTSSACNPYGKYLRAIGNYEWDPDEPYHGNLCFYVVTIYEVSDATAWTTINRFFQKECVTERVVATVILEECRPSGFLKEHLKSADEIPPEDQISSHTVIRIHKWTPKGIVDYEWMGWTESLRPDVGVELPAAHCKDYRKYVRRRAVQQLRAIAGLDQGDIVESA